MPEMITGKKTQRYSAEFKVKSVTGAIRPTGASSRAQALDIHHFMLPCRRKEYSEETFAMKRVGKALLKIRRP